MNPNLDPTKNHVHINQPSVGGISPLLDPATHYPVGTAPYPSSYPPQPPYTSATSGGGMYLPQAAMYHSPYAASGMMVQAPGPPQIAVGQPYNTEPTNDSQHVSHDPQSATPPYRHPDATAVIGRSSSLHSGYSHHPLQQQQQQQQQQATMNMYEPAQMQPISFPPTVAHTYGHPQQQASAAVAAASAAGNHHPHELGM